MTRIKVWDFPTRLFHWLLAAIFLAAFSIAQFTSDESSLFPVHALLGLVIGLMALFRIIWGFVGSRYARFSSFSFSPGDLIGYVRDVSTGKGKRYIGHNPGSAYAIYAMLTLLLAIVATGLLSRNGNELFAELHEFFAYAMIATVAAHVLGVVWHMTRHRENIILSMVTGSKDGVTSEGILSFRPIAGFIFMLLIGSWAAGLLNTYDANTRQTMLPIIGTSVQLGENEDKAGKRDGGDRDHHENDDD